MFLLDIPIEIRIYIGIAAMLVLFTSFIVAMVIGQRKKLQYHKQLQELMKQRQQLLAEKNKELEEKVLQRTEELAEKNIALQNSLEDLSNTQEQLIQREKLASLGELTAGIAHEIKNPLNFVNNFSDVSIELMDELMHAIKKGQGGEVEELAENIKGNLEKIASHGRRADSIVKGMLSHARTATTQEELCEINKLVEECVQLSYQGFRARKKGFNAAIVTNYDKTNPSITINMQEVGRAIINICNNALYALEEKAKDNSNADYEPTLSATTKASGDQIDIEIADNGIGIEEAIKAKLFQPFFTTKPAGDGTGLGLSMTYDIITNGHNGRLSVSSQKNEGAVFTITLPVK